MEREIVGLLNISWVVGSNSEVVSAHIGKMVGVLKSQDASFESGDIL